TAAGTAVPVSSASPHLRRALIPSSGSIRRRATAPTLGHVPSLPRRRAEEGGHVERCGLPAGGVPPSDRRDEQRPEDDERTAREERAVRLRTGVGETAGPLLAGGALVVL